MFKMSSWLFWNVLWITCCSQGWAQFGVEQDLLNLTISATCQGSLMTVRVETKLPFQGVVHVCDRQRGDCSRKPGCTAYGDGGTDVSFRINMQAKVNDSDYCGVQDNSFTRSVPITVRFHRTLELADDKHYVITCGRTGLRNSRNESVDSYMRLYDDEAKRPVTEAIFGRRYKLRVGSNNLDAGFGYRPTTCFAFGGASSSLNNTVTNLYDKRGCPEIKFMTKFRLSERGYYETEFPMFRMSDSRQINIQCDVIVCKGGCVEPLCDDDLPAQGRAIGNVPEPDGTLLASFTFYVYEPGERVAAALVEERGMPMWLLYLCIAFGILFLIMLIINIFLCTAMTCSCTKTEVIEKEPSIIEEYDPYRSWHGSQYSLNGKLPGYMSGGSTMNSTRSYSTNSDHYAIVHSRPGSRYSGPGPHSTVGPVGTNKRPHRERDREQQQHTSRHRDPHIGHANHGFGPESTSGSHYSGKMFSSGDLAELDDNDPEVARQKQLQQQQQQQQQQPHYPSAQARPESQAYQAGPAAGQPQAADLSLPLKPGSKTISAPTSPTKSRESFLQRVSSLTGVGRQDATATSGGHSGVGSARGPYNKDKCFTLLVVDDQNTDWSKYFRGRKVQGDCDVRVEQAEFRELSVTASTDGGCIVSMAVVRNGTKVARSFRPDFLLVRQNLRDAGEDYKSLLLGLKYGAIPSINTLEAVYHFQDKPWVFGHLMQIQRRMGKEAFPLIEQSFFPHHREMLSAPRLPAVVKIGHAHGGLGKLKVETAADFQDAASVVAVAGTYCTVEPYVESKFDVHIQKVGNSYKAFMRKSISGNWKTNQGSAMLEQLPMTDRYRSWIDAVSDQFGGLDLCALEVLVSKEGREVILELNDCALPLLGDSQEEDRRLIAELVLHRMHTQCRPYTAAIAGTVPIAIPAAVPASGMVKVGSRPSMAGIASTSSSLAASPTEDKGGLMMMADRASPASVSSMSTASTGGGPSTTPQGAAAVQPPPPVPPRAESSIGGNPFTQSVTGATRSLFGRQSSATTSSSAGQTDGLDDGEDTMKNLRKTFAGIFGDM